MKYAISSDNTKIAYESHGDQETVLLFVHGWLGSRRWWDKQRDFFQASYQIVQMDMAGHGDSDKNRLNYTAKLYASDIVTVAKEFPTKNIILIGHSMSGIYVTMASLEIPNIKGVILVDTMKNLDFKFEDDQIKQVMEIYNHNFEFGVKNIFPQFLFSLGTPAAVKASLEKEFLDQKEFAGPAIEDFYKTDVRPFASLVSVPVRAVNSEVPPTEKTINLKYFKNFDFLSIANVGHYPMLEAPQEFNEKLALMLNSF